MKSVLHIAFIAAMFQSISLFAQAPDSLIGRFEREAFLEAPFAEWYFEEYSEYEPQQSVVSAMEGVEELEILIFLGTWCSDSRREVPRFLKILDLLPEKAGKLSFIGLNRKKTAPEYQENIWHIEYVPTFIFLKDGRELGRIIETPQLSLEEDMKSILSSK
jgi:thiol-disulfide isomerase/thioredoxin